MSDLVSVGLLTRVFSPEVVDEVIAKTGRKELRHRSLSARVMAYFGALLTSADPAEIRSAANGCMATVAK